MSSRIEEPLGPILSRIGSGPRKPRLLRALASRKRGAKAQDPRKILRTSKFAHAGQRS